MINFCNFCVDTVFSLTYIYICYKQNTYLLKTIILCVSNYDFESTIVSHFLVVAKTFLGKNTRYRMGVAGHRMHRLINGERGSWIMSQQNSCKVLNEVDYISLRFLDQNKCFFTTHIESCPLWTDHLPFF